MADAKGKTATIKVRADLADGHEAGFSASGTVITFRGFLAAYEEGTDAGRYDTKSGESRLPGGHEGQSLSVVKAEADGHTTAPPPRFTEASLVKQLEELGIGRPSTYAATDLRQQYVTERRTATYCSNVSMKLGNDQLTEAVDGALEDMHSDGTLSELSKEYFYGEDVTKEKDMDIMTIEIEE